MNQPLNQHEPATTTHLRGARFAAGVSLSAMLALVLGCTGSIGNPGGTTGPGPGMPGGTAGAGGQGGDPYAIPPSPPAAVLVPTSRIARLSRLQWSNSVRDLLKLTDISDIDSGVTGDALTGFDNEVDALFVT